MSYSTSGERLTVAKGKEKGITGLFAGERVSKMSSVLIILLGVIAFILGGFSFNNPIYAVLLIGIGLIIQGITLYISD